MESERIEATIHELTSFAQEAARTLASHKTALQRHEEILHAQYKGGASHRDAIEALRKDMLALTELVNSQSTLLTSMQRVLQRIVKSLGINPEESTPESVN